uniref:Uncharacterized protein n=1 Tax=Tanacetum cinerariifolium TaxID=118510 RepID=A0A6L2LGK6_TANCI|nr:hypothetical protein [Tanacetum cinerariifolium]
MYREFEEQRRGYQQMKEKNDDMYEKMTRFMEDMRRVSEANTTPLIADKHFSGSDISGFESYQGVPSSFHTLPNNRSFFNMATPSNWQTSNQSNWLSLLNWQTPNPSYLGTPNSQLTIPSQPAREVAQSNYVCGVPDAYAFRLLPQILLSFQVMKVLRNNLESMKILKN